MSSGITVVTPAHPPRIRDGYLARSLESVAAQTLLPDKVSLAVDTGPVRVFPPEDWRMAVDELTAELAAGEWTGDKRGAWHTRQRALDAVETKWTAFLDADDEFLPEHLALHAKWAEAEGADFIYAWFEVRGTRPCWDPFPPWFFTEPWHDDAPRHTTMTVMVRTELAQSIGFTAPGPGDVTAGNEDHRFIMACYAAGAKMVHIPATRTWRWWWHQENTSGLTSKW